MLKFLEFRPLAGIHSADLQMILSNLMPKGKEPPSEIRIFHLEDGDKLSCHVSTPLAWSGNDRTVVLLHGLGGSHRSAYMIRLSRKFFKRGVRVIRVNMRGCGSGRGLNQYTYHGGLSNDMLTVLKSIKSETPLSPITLIGFSLGGNLGIKLAGELGRDGHQWVQNIIAVCSPLDLSNSTQLIKKKRNWLYQKYFMRFIKKQYHLDGNRRRFEDVQDFDEKVTAPMWGYKSAEDYYETCSSKKFISKVEVRLDIILAKDDPFVDHRLINEVQPSSSTTIWLTNGGGHMGFIGKMDANSDLFWMDNVLLNWKPSLL